MCKLLPKIERERERYDSKIPLKKTIELNWIGKIKIVLIICHMVHTHIELFCMSFADERTESMRK